MRKLLIFLLPVTLLIACNASNEKENMAAELKMIASPAGDSTSIPYLFTDESGTVHLSWVERKGKTAALKYASLVNGNWSDAVTIASGDNWFVNWADYPSICADGKNNMIAHYLEKSDTGKFTYDVKYAVSSDNGKTWSASRTLHDDAKLAEHGFVSMKTYGDHYFVSWLDGRNAAMEGDHSGHEGHHGEMTIRAAVLKKDGTKLNDWELDSRVCDCCQTSVAITDNGPIVVYRDRSAEEIRDMSIVRWVNDQWTEPKSIYQDNWKIAGCPVNGPRADAIGNNLAIAWFSMADNKARPNGSSGRGEVKIVFSKDGGETLGKPIRIDEGEPIGRVAVKMLDEKSAMVTWMEGSSIKAVKVHADGTKEPSFMVASSSDKRSSGFPQMTRSGNKIFFAWTDDKSKTVRVAFIEL